MLHSFHFKGYRSLRDFRMRLDNNTAGASSDGTFGSLSTTVASATTDVGTGSGQGANPSLNRSVKPGSLVITLTNDSIPYPMTHGAMEWRVMSTAGQAVNQGQYTLLTEWLK